MKKVSVLVPIYNVEHYLSKCIDSIINQSYKNLEIILVDDGSPDNCPAICDEYAKKDSRIKVIHKKNGGLSSARNAGISAATGEYVTFVDADDWLDIDAYDCMVNLLEENNTDCVRMWHYNNRDGHEEVPKLSIRTGLYTKNDIPHLFASFIAGKESCFTWLLIIKRTSLQRFGSFDEKIDFLEDVCFFIELLTTIQNIYITNNPKYHYLHNQYSMSNSPDRYDKNMKGIIATHNKIVEILTKNGYYSDYIKEIEETTRVILLTGYLFKAYKNNSADMNRVLEMFTYLRNDKTYRNMASDLDLSKIPLHHRQTIKYTLNNNFDSLIWFFKLRVLASRMKDLIKGPR